MQFLEVLAVLLVDPDHATEAVHHQFSGLDPAVDLTFRGLIVIGDLADRLEWRIAIGFIRRHFSPSRRSPRWDSSSGGAATAEAGLRDRVISVLPVLVSLEHVFSTESWTADRANSRTRSVSTSCAESAASSPVPLRGRRLAGLLSGLIFISAEQTRCCVGGACSIRCARAKWSFARTVQLECSTVRAQNGLLPEQSSLLSAGPSGIFGLQFAYSLGNGIVRDRWKKRFNAIIHETDGGSTDQAGFLRVVSTKGHASP